MGRHSSPDDDEDPPSSDAGDVAAPAVAITPVVATRHSSSAVADLRLMLHTRRLLLQSSALVAVIFAVYSLSLAGMDRQRDWLLFLFIPMGLAGVVVGALLDRAHRHMPDEPDGRD